MAKGRKFKDMVLGELTILGAEAWIMLTTDNRWVVVVDKHGIEQRDCHLCTLVELLECVPGWYYDNEWHTTPAPDYKKFANNIKAILKDGCGSGSVDGCGACPYGKFSDECFHRLMQRCNIEE